MKIINIIRRYGAPVLLSLLSASYIAQAQIVNPSQPATGVPLAGTGISVAGQTVSVNYGVANSPFTGNMTIGGTLGVTGASTLGATSATTLSASSTVSGAGFTAFMASPPAIGSTVANSGAFTTLSNSGTFTSTGAAVLNGAISGSGVNVLPQTAATLTSTSTALSATASAQSIDSFPVATFRACKYVVQVTQGTNYQAAELLVVNDGTNTTLTVYALVSTTGSQFATYSTTITGGNLILSTTYASGATAGVARVSATRVTI